MVTACHLLCPFVFCGALVTEGVLALDSFLGKRQMDSLRYSFGCCSLVWSFLSFIFVGHTFFRFWFWFWKTLLSYFWFWNILPSWFFSFNWTSFRKLVILQWFSSSTLLHRLCFCGFSFCLYSHGLLLLLLAPLSFEL